MCEQCNGFGYVEGVAVRTRPDEETPAAIPCSVCRPEDFIRFYGVEAHRTGNPDLVKWARQQIDHQ